MRLPVIQGLIRRRLLVNFRADLDVVQRILPRPFTPKVHNGSAIVGICLIRLEQIRPKGLPSALGLSSENAAHRFAVEWMDEAGVRREGVFIPRRDTSSKINHLAGGRVFPGEHHIAKFSVVDTAGHIELRMQSLDGAAAVKVTADETDAFPSSSCFRSLTESSAFFEGGSLGYSATQRNNRFDGLVLRTAEWRVRNLNVTSVHSGYFGDKSRFPTGSVEFDHALIMRDIRHEWQQAQDMYSQPATARP
jgi:hypothetical protein